MLDVSVPQDLLEIQTWFGTTISRRFEEDHRLPRLLSDGRSLEKEAETHLLPSATLTSHERLEIYHQQYWWRLLKSLEVNFPLVARLFGRRDFQQLVGIPYLSCFLPDHWALGRLGSTLPQWVESHYKGEDKELILMASQLDWAANESIWIQSLPKIPFSQLSEKELLSTPLLLQSHVHLFSFPLDLFSFREAFLSQEVDYWNDHPFPQVRYEKLAFLLFRNDQHHIVWRELSPTEHSILTLFNSPLTVEAVCAKIEKEGGELQEEAEKNLHVWFRNWTTEGLLSTTDPRFS